MSIKWKEKLNKIIFIAGFVLMGGIISVFTVQSNGLSGSCSVTFNYADDMKNCVSEIFIKETAESEEKAFARDIVNNEATFSIPLSWKNVEIRHRIRDGKADYTIASIVVTNDKNLSYTYEGNKLDERVNQNQECQYQISENGVSVTTDESNSSIILAGFSYLRLLMLYYIFICTCRYVIPVVLAVWIILFCIYKGENKEKREKGVICKIAIGILTLVFAWTNCLIYGNYYFEQNFKDVPIGQILYHLHTPLSGTGTNSLIKPIATVIGILIFSIVFVTVLYIKAKNKTSERTFYKSWICFTGILLVANILKFAEEFDVVDYLKYTNEKSTIYEDYYVDGRDIALNFPGKKRNLIYIFLESMETDYENVFLNNNRGENCIKELKELALDNITFSGDTTELNGPYPVNGATFTMGGLIAQTSGVSLNEKLVSNKDLNSAWVSENNYMPGVYAMGDVLEKENYNQVFMIGSNANFAGRASYFSGHGNYKIFDYYSAIENGYINSDYYVWWGYEDAKLIEYAKKELLDLSSKEEPFNLTMLTVDTHFTDGYVCNLCENKYDQQYSNVIACSSKQIANFVSWIQNQDFYDNTTIILCGDHCTMDSAYIERNNLQQLERKMYFTIVNPADSVDYENNKRTFTSLDMYPTTLAALGVQIEGDRIGLGTNLFSHEKTLAEIYGMSKLNEELLKNSNFYKKKLLYTN